MYVYLYLASIHPYNIQTPIQNFVYHTMYIHVYHTLINICHTKLFVYHTLKINVCMCMYIFGCILYIICICIYFLYAIHTSIHFYSFTLIFIPNFAGMKSLNISPRFFNNFLFRWIAPQFIKQCGICLPNLFICYTSPLRAPI